MVNRVSAAFTAVVLLAVQTVPLPARAENQMGYQLLTVDQAAALPQAGGKLGLNVGRAQQINSGGLTFELLRVNSVSPRSPGAQAGFKTGDQIIAVDGRVFPSVAAFAAYVGSKPPEGRISVDYMPASGGPQQAQRVAVALGESSRTAGGPAQPQSTGLGTGTKVAIGLGAAALFGCYKLGCFSSKTAPGQQPIGARP